MSGAEIGDPFNQSQNEIVIVGRLVLIFEIVRFRRGFV
jgi:hypothetical protein